MKHKAGLSWWARQDLNLGPMDYESTALTAELRARNGRQRLHFTLLRMSSVWPRWNWLQAAPALEWRPAKGGVFMADSPEAMKARIEELEKQLRGRRSGNLEFRVGEKGGVSVYGLGRFPVTLYYEQWIRLLDAAPDLRAFLEENKSKLKLKQAQQAEG